MIKTRFAPSPTGYIHIGNVRSAIYPYIIAKQHNGHFVLRIEDTDQNRFVDGATELIEDTLTWLGLNWDEGPIIGGPDAPYFQTERRPLYLEWAQKLIDQGRAYYDTTSPEKIQEYRDICTKERKPFLYRNFRPSKEEREKNLQLIYSQASSFAKVPIRFLSDPQPRNWHDEVMGDLAAGPETQDDIILIKADGLPTYNFAHIIDDFLMHINYVIRGVEYLPSIPNYLAIYEALNLPVPKMALLPHILAPTGNKKLGKRDGAKSVTEYRADGILPEAMLNYLANLGWNDGSEQEIYTKSELIEKFSLSKVQKSGARYDETKLYWMNGQWIRRLIDEYGIDDFYPRTEGFWPEAAADCDDNYRKRVLSIIYDRLKTLADLRSMSAYFFSDPTIDLAMITENKFLKKFSESELSALLQQTVQKVKDITWDEENLQTALNELLNETSCKPAELFSLIRIAISYAAFSPALNLTLSVLGKDASLARIQRTITALEND